MHKLHVGSVAEFVRLAERIDLTPRVSRRYWTNVLFPPTPLFI